MPEIQLQIDAINAAVSRLELAHPADTYRCECTCCAETRAIRARALSAQRYVSRARLSTGVSVGAELTTARYHLGVAQTRLARLAVRP